MYGENQFLTCSSDCFLKVWKFQREKMNFGLNLDAINEIEVIYEHNFKYPVLRA